jgi:orotate phosphoribosyltransferase
MSTDAIRLLKKHSVLHAPEGKPFVLKSGKESMYYVDVRLTALRADGITALSQDLFQTIRALGIDVRRVAGVALGGCPLATGVSMCGQALSRMGDHHEEGHVYPVYDALYIRPQAKDHGTAKLIEGQFEPNDCVVLLEDVTTTGGSSVKAIEVLHSWDLRVVGVVTVLDREGGGKEAIEAYGIPFKALVTLKELLAP